MANVERRKRATGLVALGLALVFPLFFNRGSSDTVRFSIDFQGNVPGLRYRNDPNSLFKRSATAFETELGMSTSAEIAGAVQFLATRYGIQAACAPIRVTDVFNSNFLTGDIKLTDGAWGIYRAEDLAGGPCPTTTLDPRQPGLYLETIIQKGNFFVQMSIDDVRFPIQPQVELVQAIIFGNKPNIVLGGTYAAEHGAYTLVPLSPADLLEPWDNLLYGEMRFSWFGLNETAHFESFEPSTMSPAGAFHQKFTLSHPRLGSGIYVADYVGYATSWAADPELTGNAVLGIPRNPLLTPRMINFLYTGVGRFPHTPDMDRHVICVNNFSDPANLQVCPPEVPQQ